MPIPLRTTHQYSESVPRRYTAVDPKCNASENKGEFNASCGNLRLIRRAGSRTELVHLYSIRWLVTLTQSRKHLDQGKSTEASITLVAIAANGLLIYDLQSSQILAGPTVFTVSPGSFCTAKDHDQFGERKRLGNRKSIAVARGPPAYIAFI